MKLLRLHLQAFGPFTDRVLDLAPAGQSLTLVHGPNEAGKSSTLRAIGDLRFGIPHTSPDDFVHDYAAMRIGGVFLDARGERHALVRRKGRGSTLARVRLDADPPVDDGPAPPELVALLTGGLTREEHDAMFGIDHAGLRAGGEALLKGEGEVGAALFEASAGVRSIATVLARLDQEARAFLMPGARGRNARINEALRRWDEQHAASRAATVRPAQWAELSRARRDAGEALAALERESAQLHAQRLSIGERRAVAPLLREHDTAAATLAALADVPLLPSDATAIRASAASALADARDRIRRTTDDIAQWRARLATLHPDTAVLDASAAIERLGAAAETFETHRATLDRTVAEVAACETRLATLARQIAPTTHVSVVLDRAPPAAARVDIEARLDAVADAARALAANRDALERLAVDAEDLVPALPSAQSRTALRAALAEVNRHDATLRRRDELPAAIATHERAVAAMCHALGIADAEGVARPRPMLDADIDAAQRALDDPARQRATVEARIADTDAKLAAAASRRDGLLAAGDVPTPDDLAVARDTRDAAWSEVRRVFVDGADVGSAPDPQLADHYVATVQAADRIADALGRDAERAAVLQACHREIAKLVDERAHLVVQRDTLRAEDDDRRAAWSRALADAALPDLSPAALREWQSRLEGARAAIEVLYAARDELARAEATAGELASALHLAIAATGGTMPAADRSLRALATFAQRVEEDLRQREKAADTAVGQQRERERQKQALVARAATLEQVLRDAEGALAPALAQLLLPADATIAVARARLGEFVALLDGRARLDEARLAQTHARDAIAAIEHRAATLAASLGETPPTDVRRFADRLASRLTVAVETQQQCVLATQALTKAESDRRGHEAASRAAEAQLAALCATAGVASADDLPEAEARSQRRRDAEAARDRARTQLADASPRTLDELRALLRDHDPVALDAEQAACDRELEAIEGRLAVARERDATARGVLDAVDSADTAAAAREAMASAEASVLADLDPWRRSRLAHALLGEALKRFRERAQGPMLADATGYFRRMTGDAFVQLRSDDADERPVLVVERADGTRVHVDGMSEGTRDQLYLALRLAALDLRRRGGTDLPLILDDVLMTSDDARAARMLATLADFSKASQVIVFTHHAHLVDVARDAVDASTLAVVTL